MAKQDPAYVCLARKTGPEPNEDETIWPANDGGIWATASQNCFNLKAPIRLVALLKTAIRLVPN